MGAQTRIDHVSSDAEIMKRNLASIELGYRSFRVSAEHYAWLAKDRIDARRDLEPIVTAARKVCWFDWSDNDPDAVAAIDALRVMLDEASVQNCGHGHVRPRPDGVKARCGGPALCAKCKQEADEIGRVRMTRTTEMLSGSFRPTKNEG